MGPLLDSADGVCFAYFIPVYNVLPEFGRWSPSLRFEGRARGSLVAGAGLGSCIACGVSLRAAPDAGCSAVGSDGVLLSGFPASH
jgi:hypothetical protein